MKLRKFKALISQKGRDDLGFSGITFEVDQLVKDKIYEQADQRNYDEMGRRSKPFFVDDNGCSRDIEKSLKDGIVEEIFDEPKKKLLTEEMLNKPKFMEDKQSQLTYDIRQLSKKNIDFDVILDSGIKLQRDFVWTQEQKEQLVISMMKGIAIPNIYIYDYTNEDNQETLKIIDGKQRISTLIDYYQGKFPIVVDGEEYYFDDLHSWLKSRIAGRPLTTIVFYGYYDDKISDDDLIDAFKYVNFTGTPQDKDHLTKLIKSKTM